MTAGREMALRAKRRHKRIKQLGGGYEDLPIAKPTAHYPIEYFKFP
jgi:hypothetical protein